MREPRKSEVNRVERAERDPREEIVIGAQEIGVGPLRSLTLSGQSPTTLA